MILLGLCLNWSALAQSSCLSVTSNEWSKKGTEFGITYIEWEAELTNECETGYDADLSIQFVDADGEVLYESLDLITVSRGSSTKTRREFNLPTKDYERLEDILVIIQGERERPF